jgi:SPP1 gp7 family putative phage head morphogenesis protein
VKHAVLLERLKAAQVKGIVSLLDKKVIPDVRTKLAQRLANIRQRGFDTGPETTLRVKQLQESLDATLRTAMRGVGKEFAKDLKATAINEAEFQRAMLRDVTPIEFDYTMPSVRTLESMVTSNPFQGRVLGEWFDTLGGATARRLSDQLNIGLVQGESIDNLLKRAQNVLGNSKHQAAAIVRTATNHVTTQAREATYEENSDIVKAVQFVATLDNRTTEICASNDGRVYNIGDGPRPPLHYNCRSTTVPVLRSWKELGFDIDEVPETTRASMDGQVPARQTYPQWLKGQSAEVQKEVLGAKNAALFRKGRFKFTTNVYGPPLTLSELKKREKRILTRL